jgi:hypothetical protein
MNDDTIITVLGKGCLCLTRATRSAVSTWKFIFDIAPTLVQLAGYLPSVVEGKSGCGMELKQHQFDMMAESAGSFQAASVIFNSGSRL